MQIVTGADGFIGGALVRRLRSQRREVAAYGRQIDLVSNDLIFEPRDEVFHLAADTGGIGYVHNEPGRILEANLRLDLSVLETAERNDVSKLFYTSSACVYRWQSAPLREKDAHPASPDGAIGWAKLTGEKLFLSSKLDVRIGRLHSIYGPGCRLGPKEKAITALCRKVAQAQDGDFIEVWGDGLQIRSFTYIDDCIEGILALMRSDLREPANIGDETPISIGSLTQMLIDISGKDLRIQYVDGPVGPMYRVPDSSLLKAATGWRPKTPLRQGLVKTYGWVQEQLGG